MTTPDFSNIPGISGIALVDVSKIDTAWLLMGLLMGTDTDMENAVAVPVTGYSSAQYSYKSEAEGRDTVYEHSAQFEAPAGLNTDDMTLCFADSDGDWFIMPPLPHGPAWSTQASTSKPAGDNTRCRYSASLKCLCPPVKISGIVS